MSLSTKLYNIVTLLLLSTVVHSYVVFSGFTGFIWILSIVPLAACWVAFVLIMNKVEKLEEDSK